MGLEKLARKGQSLDTFQPADGLCQLQARNRILVLSLPVGENKVEIARIVEEHENRIHKVTHRRQVNVRSRKGIGELGAHALLRLQRHGTVRRFADLLQDRQSQPNLPLVMLARLRVEGIESASLRGLVHAFAVVRDAYGDDGAILGQRKRDVPRARLDGVLRGISNDIC